MASAGNFPSLPLTLPKETAVLITLDYSKECFQGLDFKSWLVPMPLQIPLHPEDPPMTPAANEGGLCHGRLALGRGVVERRSDFKYFDAVSVNSAGKVDSVPDMRWRSATLQKG